jgi:glycosyltransferase involved in cell wall biosynthesis
MKALLELRPAFDGHSGIPQETRMLFWGLGTLEGIQTLGLLQSSNLVAEPGLPLSREVADGERVDRLSRVVVSLQQGPASHRLEWMRKLALRYGGPLAAALGGALGIRQSLTAFEPTDFEDFVWRSLFAKTLPVSCLESVTRRPYRVLRWPWSMMHAWGVATAAAGAALYPRLDTRGVDVFVAETPYPGRVSKGTALVVRYHDAIPLFMPHTVKDRGYHRAMHYHALRRNAADGAWFACVSEATRRDLLSCLPELESRAVTIPNMISHHFVEETRNARRVTEVIWSRRNRAAPHAGGRSIEPTELHDGRLRYLLMVSTIEPRKNHTTLVDAWEVLRDRHPDLHLVCVGSLGWEHEATLRRLGPWLQRGGLHLLEGVPSEDLRLLYRHAQVTVCPSLGEGFDFSGVEAMASGGIVVASDIPVHRDVFGAAAEYFNAYSVEELVGTLDRLLGTDGEPRRIAMVAEGARTARRYRPEVVLPEWLGFLRRVVAR